MSEPKLIGVCGDIGAGKSTVANILKHEHGFAQVSLAYPLKKLAIEIFGLESRHVFGTQTEKDEPIPHVRGADGEPRTARYILEYLGTEAFRTVDPDVWAKLARRRIVELINPSLERMEANTEAKPRHAPRRVVVPDVRFPNEFERLRELGGVVWKVVRVGFDSPRTGHESDEAWRLESHDAILVASDGDLAGLAREVGDALRIGGRRHVELLRR